MKHIQKVISDDVLVRNIDENMIRNITEKMYTFGDLSLNYTKQTKTTLSIMLNYAVEKKYIKQNLALNVKIQRKKAEEEKRKKNMDEKYLDQSEMTELLVYMRKSTKRLLHANIAELLYLTGLRYGELQALQVKDFDGSTLDINGTLDYSFLKMADAIKTSPKNIYSKRIVSLPNRAVKIVNEIIEHNSLVFGSQSNEDYIFKSSRGTPLSLHSFNMVLHRVQDELKWDKNLSSHIFRHSHISLLAELNLPLKTIMERVGHSDANTTLSIYNHVTKKSKEQVIDRLNNL
jgi:integrase